MIYSTGAPAEGSACQYVIPPPAGEEFAGDPGIVRGGTIDADGACSGWPELAPVSPEAPSGAIMAPPVAWGRLAVVGLAALLGAYFFTRPALRRR